MSTDQFPMFRLATLLARQFSAPIAARIKTYATTHPRVRRAVIARAGRIYRAAELRFKLWMLRLPAPARTPPLADAAAVQVGADIIGEVIIFSMGAAIIVFEVNRQAVKQEMKVLDERSQWVAILVALQELQRELVLQQQDLDRLQAVLQQLDPTAPAPAPAPAGPAAPAPAAATPAPAPAQPPTAPTETRGGDSSDRCRKT